MERLPDAWTRARSALNSSPRLLLASLVALYLAIVTYQATTRLLWVDELITLAVARQGSALAIWHTLAQGTDPNPPFTHCAVLLSTNLLGENPLAIRLPSILAMLLAILALWTILRRWVEPAFAALGILAFMATRGFDYAYEARSYAALTGFTMAALALWLSSTASVSLHSARPSRSGNFFVIAGIGLCLAAAVSSNYYGALAWFPVAIGESLFTYRNSRVRSRIWFALAAAALPLGFYLPLIRHNLAQFAPHAWNRANTGMLGESYFVLVEGIVWPVVFGAAWLVWRRRIPSHDTPSAQQIDSLPASQAPELHELAALATLLLYPVLGLLVAFAGAGIISPRCTLPVCCGFAAAGALIASRIFRQNPRVVVLLVCAALFWVVARESACAVLLHRQRTAFFALRDRIAQMPDNTSILLADSNLALPLAFYSTPQLRARLVYPIDFTAIHASEPDDSGEQNLWAGRNGIFPFHIVPYTPELAAAPAVIFTRSGGWLAASLIRDGAILTDLTSLQDAVHLSDLGGVFTPLAHDRTRLFAVAAGQPHTDDGPRVK